MLQKITLLMRMELVQIAVHGHQEICINAPPQYIFAEIGSKQILVFNHILCSALNSFSFRDCSTESFYEGAEKKGFGILIGLHF